MRRRPIITLLTDFGLVDSYVAEIKAVILSICPDAQIVDISHEVRKFDIRMGAFLLMRASRFFPKGTIHVAVVDPGVGTGRRPIIVECERSIYVGPDNGILMPSAQREGIKHIYTIKNPRYMLREISRTFHGRDIFGPAAAHLARGIPPSDFGPEIFDPVIPDFSKPRILGDSIEGEIIHVDDFGNLITNITSEELRAIGVREGEKLAVRLGGRDFDLRLCAAYGDVEPNMPLTLIGSCGLLEISVNQGDASKLFGVGSGERIVVHKRIG